MANELTAVSFAGKGRNGRIEARLSLSEDGGISVPGERQPRGGAYRTHEGGKS